MDHAEVGRALHIQGIAVLHSQRLDLRDNIGDQLVDREGRQIQRHPASLDPRKVEDVVDQGQQALASQMNFDHIGNKAWLVGAPKLLLQQVAIADDRGQRRAQLVAHIGQK